MGVTPVHEPRSRISLAKGVAEMPAVGSDSYRRALVSPCVRQSPRYAPGRTLSRSFCERKTPQLPGPGAHPVWTPEKRGPLQPPRQLTLPPPLPVSVCARACRSRVTAAVPFAELGRLQRRLACRHVAKPSRPEAPRRFQCHLSPRGCHGRAACPPRGGWRSPDQGVYQKQNGTLTRSGGPWCWAR